MKRHRILMATAALALVSASALAQGNEGKPFQFRPNTLVLSRSVYAGDSGTVAPGQILPPGCIEGVVKAPLIKGGDASVDVACAAAVDNGEFPNLQDDHNVWNNAPVDGSFGVTSPIFLDNIDKQGKVIGTLAVPT